MRFFLIFSKIHWKKFGGSRFIVILKIIWICQWYRALLCHPLWPLPMYPYPIPLLRIPPLRHPWVRVFDMGATVPRFRFIRIFWPFHFDPTPFMTKTAPQKIFSGKFSIFLKIRWYMKIQNKKQGRGGGLFPCTTLP